MFTYEQLQGLVPQKQRNIVTEEFVETINKVAVDPTYGDEFKENIVSYSTILSQGKFTMDEYMNATKFVTLLLLEHKDIDAYKETFPDRYDRLITKGLTRSQISPYATNFKKTKLVAQILEQTMMPTYVLNAPLYQEALNHTRMLMLTAKSETVQQKSAEALMVQLKAPEAAKLEVDVSINRADVVNDNEAIMRQLAAEKLKVIALGGDVKAIANMSGKVEDIIDVEEEKL